MARFFFRHVLLHRSQIMDRGLMSMRVRLARKRRLIRRAAQSLRAMTTEVARKRRFIRHVGQLLRPFRVAAAEDERMSVVNTLIDWWVNNYLVELGNDPLMRNAFEISNAQSLDARTVNNMNQAQPLPGWRHHG